MGHEGTAEIALSHRVLSHPSGIYHNAWLDQTLRR